MARSGSSTASHRQEALMNHLGVNIAAGQARAVLVRVGNDHIHQASGMSTRGRRECIGIKDGYVVSCQAADGYVSVRLEVPPLNRQHCAAARQPDTGASRGYG